MYESGTQNQARYPRREQQSARRQPGTGRDERGERSTRGHDRDSAEQSMRVVEWAIRGTNVLLDIQMSALRNLWHMQARSAAAFGIPDCSDFVRSADDGAKRLMSTGTEQILDSARRATDAIAEMQRQFGRIVEQGAMRLSADMQQGIEELGERTQQGMQEVAQLAEQTVEESERMLEEASRRGPRNNSRSASERGRSVTRLEEAESSAERGADYIPEMSAEEGTETEGGQETRAGAQTRGGRHGEAQRNGRAAKRH